MIPFDEVETPPPNLDRTSSHSASGAADDAAVICIVVPTRNSASTLEACLSSIRDQTSSCILIVVDNSSTDGTLSIARRFADLVLVAGPERSAQRNAGARATSAAIVGFIDSDMTLEATVVSEVRDLITRGADAVIVPERTVGTGFWTKVRAFERSFYVGSKSIEAARFFRRDLFERVGGFDERLTGPEDWDLTMRVDALGTVDRTTSGIDHLEGRLDFRHARAKKRHYATGMALYLRKHGWAGMALAVDRPWIRRPQKLFAPHPFLGAGLVALKVGELGSMLGAAFRHALRLYQPSRTSQIGAVPSPTTFDLRATLSGRTIAVAVPAYEEGPGIVMALSSIRRELDRLGLLQDVTVLLSDSSSTDATVAEATAFAEASGLRIVIDRSENRRPLKEALNAVFDRATADIVVVASADVELVPGSLERLLRYLIDDPRVVAVIGGSRPHPQARGLRRRAGAWQIETLWHLAKHLPPENVRAEGSLWAVRREFYAGYRYPVGEGSIADDVELQQALRRRQLDVRNAYDAYVYKIPMASLRDFALSQLRWQYARRHEAPHPRFALVALHRALRDPLGAACYGYARLWARRHAALLKPLAQTELWAIGQTTKTLSLPLTREKRRAPSRGTVNAVPGGRPIVAIVTYGPVVRVLHGGAVRALTTAATLQRLGCHPVIVSAGTSADSDGTVPGTDVAVIGVRRYWWHSLRFAVPGGARLLPRDAAVVVTESALFLPMVLAGRRDVPIVWDTTECETLHYSRMPRTVRNRAAGAAWRAIEGWAVARVSAVVAISDAEATWWRRLFPASDPKLRVVVHRPLFQASAHDAEHEIAEEEGHRPIVTFVGNMMAKHNRAAARWLVDELAPVLPESAMVEIIGPGSEHLEIPPKLASRVRCLGPVADVDTRIARATLCVAPLAAGAGVKTKVLHYVAHGRRVIGTPAAFEGIEDCPGTRSVDLSELPGAVIESLATEERVEDVEQRIAAQREWLARSHGDALIATQWAAVLRSVGVDARDDG